MAHQALVEHLSMRTLAHLGLSVADTEMESFLSEDALVVTRFDRAADDEGEVRRLHQEDLCQALAIGQKYEELGGPSAADIVALLHDHSRTAAQGAANVRRFVDGVIGNVILGAPDAHARNYAVLLDGEDVHVAPLFDAASALSYDRTPGRPLRGSMSIGGSFDLTGLDAAAWLRFAQQVGGDGKEIIDRVRTLAAQAPEAFERACAETDADGVDDVRARMLPHLREHAADLIMGTS
jgi:serine/threonine-protein kinase HipA